MEHLDLIVKLVEDASRSKDDIDRELSKDLCDAAYKYAGFRLQWNFYSYDEMSSQDAYRTSAHNRMIDCFNIFFRYEASKGITVPDFTVLDRKTVGDYGCELVAKMANLQR